MLLILGDYCLAGPLEDIANMPDLTLVSLLKSIVSLFL